MALSAYLLPVMETIEACSQLLQQPDAGTKDADPTAAELVRVVNLAASEWALTVRLA